jgi:hypothetical protein
MKIKSISLTNSDKFGATKLSSGAKRQNAAIAFAANREGQWKFRKLGLPAKWLGTAISFRPSPLPVGIQCFRISILGDLYLQLNRILLK